MGLREQAEADLATLVEDLDGFGWPVTLTSPAGAPTSLVALTGDIAALLDPETGEAVLGRTISATLRVSSLPAGPIPRGVAELGEKPWRVTFLDLQGATIETRVTDTRPDYTLGVLVCRLEVYQP